MQVITCVIGLVIAAFGFAVMRNPMRFALLARGQEGYYQRLVLDTSLRNQLRLVGSVLSVFGAMILTEFLGQILKVGSLDRVSNGFLVLLYVLFGGCFLAGILLFIAQLAKGGESFDWFYAWKTGTELGPIEVVPPVAPKMQREAGLVTVCFSVVVLFTVTVSLLV